MELINHTQYPSLLFRTTLQNDMLAASVAVRVTYSIDSFKALINNSQHWELHKTEWVSAYGNMESDNIYKRGGVDIFAFGSARLPGNEPFEQMEVKIKVSNKLSHKIRIFGNRVWEQGILGITKSKIEPVKEIPMLLSNAFGGVAEWDGLKLPYENNPFGKGYYWQKEDAINNTLPNIEDANKLIMSWSDRPDPVGTSSCPMNELHIRNNIEFNKESHQITKINTRLFNAAFPNMIVNEIAAGDKIIIEGMTTKKDFVFEIPRHDLFILIKLGNSSTERALVIDQVGLVPEKNEAFITYRFPFRYHFKEKQVREINIYEKN